MAITREVDVRATIEEERTARIVIRTPRDGRYSVSVHREIVPKDTQGAPVGNPRPIPIPINRAFVDVLGESVELRDGTVITLPQLAEMISKLADRWASEDAAPAKAKE